MRDTGALALLLAATLLGAITAAGCGDEDPASSNESSGSSDASSEAGIGRSGADCVRTNTRTEAVAFYDSSGKGSPNIDDDTPIVEEPSSSVLRVDFAVENDNTYLDEFPSMLVYQFPDARAATTALQELDSEILTDAYVTEDNVLVLTARGEPTPEQAEAVLDCAGVGEPLSSSEAATATPIDVEQLKDCVYAFEDASITDWDSSALSGASRFDGFEGSIGDYGVTMEIGLNARGESAAADIFVFPSEQEAESYVADLEDQVEAAEQGAEFIELDPDALADLQVLGPAVVVLWNAGKQPTPAQQDAVLACVTEAQN